MKAQTIALSASDYERAFEAERRNDYPAITAFEQRRGFAIDRATLEDAARVLACPVKDHPPNWQHGRVLYALAREYQARSQETGVRVLDIGTAKGFSALCLLWAFRDAGAVCEITSVDVLDPNERVRRNTIAEVDGYKTLHEILAPWPDAQAIRFVKSTGQLWLTSHTERIHLAFVDGKHSYDAVSWEAALLAERQRTGDVVMFDDVQIPGVAKALAEVRAYTFESLEVLPGRRYAIGVRR